MAEQSSVRTAGLVLTSTQVVQHPGRAPERRSEMPESEEEQPDWGGNSPAGAVHIPEVPTVEPSSEGADVTNP